MSDYLPPANGEETDLIAYAGRWVALLDGQIAGQGFSRESALESARDSRPKERPLVRLIPPPDGTTIYQILELIRPALPQDKPIYVVGGAVRDHLLQRPIHDLDFVITGNGIPPARAAANYLGGEFYALDEARGTGRVLLYRPDGRRLVLDFAAMRGKSLEEDQSGRDFTINSIAIDAQDPEKVFDPLGGAMDIRKKIIRACTQYAFEDDPLRVLRAVRLATGLGFQLTAETRTLLRESAPLLDLASGERQRDEILKILGGPKPAVSIRALEILGVLPHLFPEMLALKGLKQSSPHTLDVWEHTLSTLGYLDHILGVLGVLEHDPEASGNLATGLAVMRLGRYRTQIHNHLEDSSVPDRNWRGLLMLAALYHDAGKAETRSLD